MFFRSLTINLILLLLCFSYSCSSFAKKFDYTFYGCRQKQVFYDFLNAYLSNDSSAIDLFINSKQCSIIKPNSKLAFFPSYYQKKDSFAYISSPNFLFFRNHTIKINIFSKNNSSYFLYGAFNIDFQPKYRSYLDYVDYKRLIVDYKNFSINNLNTFYRLQKEQKSELLEKKFFQYNKSTNYSIPIDYSFPRVSDLSSFLNIISKNNSILLDKTNKLKPYSIIKFNSSRIPIAINLHFKEDFVGCFDHKNSLRLINYILNDDNANMQKLLQKQTDGSALCLKLPIDKTKFKYTYDETNISSYGLRVISIYDKDNNLLNSLIGVFSSDLNF